MHAKYGYLTFPVLVLAVILLPAVIASNAPNVVLVSPQNNNISTSENITFVCNISDDENVYNVSLFHNINGSFERYNTIDIMYLKKDSDTTLLCRFDNSYTCEDGEQGTNFSTSFDNSRFDQGIRINSSDTLMYPTLNNIQYSQGSIEIWVYLGYDFGGDDGYVLTTDEFNQDEIRLYFSGTDVCFEFHDTSGSISDACADGSAWVQGEWHHIAALWNVSGLYGGSHEVDVYIDGTNGSTSYPSSAFSTPGSFDENIYLGTDGTGGYQSDLIIDELRISDRPRTPAEISSSYAKGANHTNETKSWTINNISDGTYLWNCLTYDNESQSSWSGSNYTIYVDVSSHPTLNSVTFSPPSEDDIDPAMNLSVFANISDISNVSYVMFQWKETDPWNNDTMDYNNVTDLYENATIEIDQTGGVYYYRIWSNDTNGNSGYSSTYNITADWDYTWNSTPSYLGSIYKYIGTSNAYLGTIIINNTGDDSLNFQITDDRPLIDIYYNVSNPFSLSAKGVAHVNVTADFPLQPGEYVVTISINASHGTQTPSPISNQVTTTLNSYTGGPYFDSNYLYMISYPTTAYHSNSYNLSAKLKNIGNETAHEVWINWTLPTGWSVTSGNQSKYIGDLNGTADEGNIAWNNITIYVSPSSSTAGVHDISLVATSNESLTANASVVTYVECNNNDDTCGAGCSYVTDDDCSIPQSPGESASIGIALPVMKNYEITLIIPGRLDVNRGESKTIQIGVNNDVKGTELSNVQLSLSGYPKTFMSASPSSFLDIGYGETKYFDVEVRAPVYAVHENYDLQITVKGDFIEGSKITGAEKTETIKLVTHKSIANDTLEYFEKAGESVSDMEESGFETRQVSQMLAEIESALDEGNYDNVREVSEDVIELKDLAFRLDKQINDLSRNVEDLNSKGFNLPETEKMLFLAKSAFQRGEYKRAEERMASALLMSTLEGGGANFWIFVYNYWWALLIVIAIIGAGLFTGRKKLLIRYMLKKLDSLEIEEKKTKELVLGIQKEYVKAKISTAEYTEMIENYERGIGELRKGRADILTMATNLMSFKKSMNLLKGEEDRVKKIIIESQKKYFLQGKMGKEYYERIMDGMKNELLEVQNQMDSLKEKKGSRGKTTLPVLTLLLITLFLTGSATAVEKGDVLNAIEDAEKTVIEMQSLGFGVTYANDTLNEAKSLFDDGYYEGAESLALKVLNIKDKAISVDELINEVELKIYELSSKGYDTSAVSEIFQSGLSEFEIDNYVDAEKLMMQVIEDLDQLEAEESLKRVQTQDTDIINMVFDYLWAILIAVLLLIVIGFRIRGKLNLKRHRSELSNLKKELELINKSITEAQKKYFIRDAMSKMDYELSTKRYNKRISLINRRISMLEEILKK